MKIIDSSSIVQMTQLNIFRFPGENADIYIYAIYIYLQIMTQDGH